MRGDRLLVAEHAALDLDAAHELLEEDLLVVRERELDGRARSSSGVAHDRDADARAEPRRLDDDAGSRTGSRRGRASQRRTVTLARDGDALVAHHRLEEVLVHADRRGGDARADVGDVRRARAAPARCRPRRTARAGRGRRRRRRRAARDAPSAGREARGRRRPSLRARACASPARGSSQRPSRPISIARDVVALAGRARRSPSGPTRARCRARSSARP